MAWEHKRRNIWWCTTDSGSMTLKDLWRCLGMEWCSKRRYFCPCPVSSFHTVIVFLFPCHPHSVTSIFSWHRPIQIGEWLLSFFSWSRPTLISCHHWSHGTIPSKFHIAVIFLVPSRLNSVYLGSTHFCSSSGNAKTVQLLSNLGGPQLTIRLACSQVKLYLGSFETTL